MVIWVTKIRKASSQETQTNCSYLCLRYQRAMDPWCTHHHFIMQVKPLRPEGSASFLLSSWLRSSRPRIDLGVPRVNIALINKYCNAALISSPSLWTHITLWLSTSRGNIRGCRMPHLVRCLELSQMHPLRVRMNSEPLEFVAQSTWTLSSVLHLCDTPRWESLTINHGGSGGEVLKEFKFPSLRSLSFIDAGSWNETSFSRGIFCALLQSRAKIKETIIPEVIFQSMPAGFDLHSLRIATTSAIVASKLLSSYSLQVLHITGPPSTLCHLKGIQLPLTVSMSSASTCTLMELR